MNYGLLVLVLFPIFAGILSYCLGQKSDKARNDCVDVAMFVQAVMLVVFIVEYIKDWKMDLTIPLVFGAGLGFCMDPVRLVFCGVLLGINFVISQFAKESLKQEQVLNGFYLAFLLLQGFGYGTVLSNSIFGIILFLIASYILMIPIMLQRQQENVVKNARNYSIFLAISVGFVVTGVMILLGFYQNTSMATLFILGGNVFNKTVALGGVLLMIGLGMWAGMFPLQQVAIRTTNVTLLEVAAISSTVLSKVSVFSMIMIARSVFRENRMVGKCILVWALMTVISGLFITLLSTDIRKMLMGINIASNGVIAVSGSIIFLNMAVSAIPNRGFLFLTIAYALSICILYMIALELVRKERTYEIKGLIASGKEHKVLMIVAFVACATLIGIPGTAGFLGQSMLLQSVVGIAKWKWLIVLYVILWSFFITAICRYYMKLFISKKDISMHVMASEEELEASNKKKEPSDPRNAFFLGESMLIVISMFVVILGVLPGFSVQKLSASIDSYFYMKAFGDGISYYQKNALVLFLIAAVLGVFWYVNLVHGISLRAIRDKKNKKIQQDMTPEEEN